MAQESFIHPTAIIDPQAKIGVGVKVGPFSIIGPHVELGDGVELKSHVVISNRVIIGAGTIIYPFVCFEAPQDLKYKGEPSTVVVGKNCVIREYVTIQPGTAGHRMETRIGDNCLLMANVHVAHDCIIGNQVIMANCATLAGHVTVEDNVIIGGLAAVHQFVTIGTHAIIGGMSGVAHDVIPYGNVKGDRAYLSGLNLIGLRRRGFEKDAIDNLRKAFDYIFAQGESSLAGRVQEVKAQYPQDPNVQQLVNFLSRPDGRSILTLDPSEE